jgi:hypothetical protein
MALTTPEEVKEIISGCTLTTDQIDPFILSGHIYLNKVFQYDATLTAMQRREIERWFVAHMLTSVGYLPSSQTQMVKREKVGEAEIEYAVTATKPGSGVDSTAYGRMAIQLDTSGLLAKAGKLQAGIYAVKSFDK